MRRFNQLMSMLLLFLVGGVGAWAQIAWKAYQELEQCTEVPAPGTLIALKGPGQNWQSEDGSKTYSLLNTYFNFTSKGSATLNGSCVFTLLEGEQKDGLPTYYLQRVSDGKYLSNDGATTTTDDLDNAFQFWLGKRTYQVEDSKFNSAISDTQIDGAPTGPLFVLRDCNSETRYLSFWNDGGYSMLIYEDTNVGEIYTVGEATDGVYIVQAALTEYPQVQFQSGNAPGDTPQDSVDAYNKAYEDLSMLLTQTSVSAEEAYAAAHKMIDAYNACSNAIVMPQAGKFYIIGGCKGRTNATLYAEDGAWFWEAVADQPTTDPKYIVKIEAGKEEGTFTVRNVATGLYLGALGNNSVQIAGVASNPADYYIRNTIGTNYFYLTQEGKSQGVHAQEAGKQAVSWNYQADASQWTFYVPTVSDEELEGILTNGTNVNTLTSLLDSATTAYDNSRAFKSGMTDDNNYADHGLLKDASQLFSSPIMGTEDGGELPVLLDGLIEGEGQYVHSSWSAATAPNYYHYIGADLGEAVSCISFKYSRRIGAYSGQADYWKNNWVSYPTKIAIYATNDTTDASSWKEVATVNPQFIVPDSTLGVKGVELGGDYRYVRFDVIETSNNKTVTGTMEGAKPYPFFYMSELGIWKAEEDPANSLSSQMDKAVVDALGQAIPKAKQVLASGTVAQSDIDDLRAAYKAFYAQYPDTTIATDVLDEARDILSWAGDGTVEGVGYAPKSAIDALQAVVDTEGAKIKPLMTRQAIEDVEAAVEKGIADYRKTVPLPEVGEIYYLINRGSAQGKGYAIVAINNNDNGRIGINYLLEGDSTKVDPVAENDLRAMWRVEMVNDSLVLRNLGTGYYLSTYNDDAVISKKPHGLTLEASRAGAFGIIINAGADMPYLNSNNNTATTYYMDNNSHIGFEKVENVGGDGQFTNITVQPGYQIVCLPYSVNGFTGVGTIYTVAGVTADNMLALNEVSEDDYLPAGTPFVLYCNAAEETQADLGFDIDDLTTEPLTVNGVVGVFDETRVPEGMGILNGTEEVVVSTVVTGTSIACNRGYIGKGLPTVESGDVVIPIDGTITAINNVVVAPAANGKTYDLQGRRVVKPTKGIYIINGKKVVVK